MGPGPTWYMDLGKKPGYLSHHSQRAAWKGLAALLTRATREVSPQNQGIRLSPPALMWSAINVSRQEKPNSGALTPFVQTKKKTATGGFFAAIHISPRAARQHITKFGNHARIRSSPVVSMSIQAIVTNAVLQLRQILGISTDTPPI